MFRKLAHTDTFAPAEPVESDLASLPIWLDFYPKSSDSWIISRVTRARYSVRCQ